MANIKPGTRVEVVRVGGETRQGYVLRGPLESLRHIGPFYHVGERPPREARPAGRPRRGAARAKPAPLPEFGMYAPEDIRVLPGAPVKL